MLDSLDALIAFVLIMLVVSLLITIAVQMASGALNLRGLNLAAGLTEILTTIAPALGGQARALATHILTDTVLSDSSIGRNGPRLWRLASAVRPDEAFAAVYRLATDQRGDKANMRDAARSFLISLGIEQSMFDTADQKAAATAGAAQNLWAAAAAAIAMLPSQDGQKLQGALDAVRARLEAHANQAVDRVVAGAASTTDQAYHKFEYWFESVQDRAQQWFTMHTRFFTVFFAVLFAGWFQLDTVEIFKLVSNNRTVRDQLVAQAGVVSSQAQLLLTDGQSVLQEALGLWLATQDEGTQRRLAGLKVGPADTRGTVRTQLGVALTQQQAKEQMLAAYDTTVDEIVRARLDEQATSFRAVKNELARTGFDLFPKDGRGRWGDRWSDQFAAHCLGMLFSAGLLSLGAPFWYNALKGLTNLRSTVAQSVSEERKQESPPTSNPSSPAPPIV